MKRETRLSGKERIRMKRIMFGLCFMLMIASGSAYWLLSYDSGEITGSVTGGISQFSITEDLSSFTLDVSLNLTETQSITIDNGDGDLNMVYTLTTEFNNTDSECYSVGDLTYTLLKDSSEIEPNANFTMVSGENNFEMEIEAINNRACSGEISLQVEFTEA